MFSPVAYIIRVVLPTSERTSVYWSAIEADGHEYAVWSFEVQDAKKYKTAAAASEFASSTHGLNLSDDDFQILPYID